MARRIKIGGRISKYIQSESLSEDFSIEKLEEKDKHFENDDENLFITCDDGIIDGVTSQKELHYSDYNVIGMDIERFNYIMSTDGHDISMTTDNIYVVYDGGDEHVCYEYDGLRAQIWVKPNRTIDKITIL